jgi:16S rRNA (guanine(1405)-N(7))-methyltransferase
MIKKRVYKLFGFISNMIDQILRQVKENKKYKTIADAVVITEIKKYLNSQQIKNFEEITKEDIKKIRSKLHKAYSSFQTKKKNKRDLYLEDLRGLLDIKNPSSKESNKINEINNNLLSITLSTKERLNSYNKIYKQIFEITGTPDSIIDLGCGLNPLSYPLIELDNMKSITYLAYDIDEEDTKFLNEYFKIMKKQNNNFKGKADILDIRDLDKIKRLPRSDIIFLFKVIDILNQSEKDYKFSEELIKNLIKKTKSLIVSFPTKTITRKQMNYPNRKWFELMLERNDLIFQTIEIENEIFYVIKM